MSSDNRIDIPFLNRDDSTHAPVSSPSGGILVLGMHRSGTSALARVLGMMGAYLGDPDKLLSAHTQDNPAGYWERGDIVAAHDRALENLHFSWDRVGGFVPEKTDFETRDALLSCLRQILGELVQSGKPWLIKDPRLCLLLPYWFELVERPACVVIVRDPREIAASMHSGPRGVFTSSYIIALWEKYLHSLLMGLRRRQALFVSYASLIDKPLVQISCLLSGLRELGVTGMTMPATDELTQFIDPGLRRSSASAHMHLSATQSDLYDWLLRQCTRTGAVTVEEFPSASEADALLAEFEQTFDYRMELGRQRADEETARQLRTTESTLHDRIHQAKLLRTELAEQRQALQRLQAQYNLQQDQLALARLETDTQRDAVTQAQCDLRLLRQQNEQILAQNMALHEQYKQTRDQLIAECDNRAQLQSELDVKRAQYAVLERHAQATGDSVRALKSSLSWKITAPIRAFAGPFLWRPTFNVEQRLHGWFYRMPGPSAAQKRAMLVWLHEHAAWLTRRTLSYRLYQQAKQLEAFQAQNRETVAAVARMDAERARAIVAAMRHPPKISIVMPVYNVERRWLDAAVDSVRRQFYPHWELCISDDASTRDETRLALEDVANNGDRRIKIARLKKNVGIAEASNAALKLATGDYVGLLDNDDELTRDALLEVARTAVASDSDIVYSDEDKLDENGHHVEPHFKSDYNEEYFFSNNYLCHFSVIRRALVDQIGGFRAGFDGAQDYDLLLRVTERTRKIVHIPKVLYHWRRIPGSTAADSAAKPHSSDAGRRALIESLARRGIAAKVQPGPFPNTFHVRRALSDTPLVSIIIPFRDKPELLLVCIESILKKTRYRHYEVLGINNGSTQPRTQKLMRELRKRDPRVSFVRYDAPFNYSAINNFAVKHARGEHLLFLNNDTEVIAADWLEAMLEHSLRPEVGVVGAKLLYPDDRIQHAGVIVGMGGVAGHAHLFQQADHPGYFGRAQLCQELSAVTFACALTRRDVFERLKGLNERDLCIAFNDVDYCLRAREAGYRVVYAPLARLYHHESKSRGFEDNPEKLARFHSEVAYMQQRHNTILQAGDPFFNPNLRLDVNDFSPRLGYIDDLPR